MWSKTEIRAHKHKQSVLLRGLQTSAKCFSLCLASKWLVVSLDPRLSLVRGESLVYFIMCMMSKVDMTVLHRSGLSWAPKYSQDYYSLLFR